jgi:hypothetical protein
MIFLPCARPHLIPGNLPEMRSEVTRGMVIREPLAGYFYRNMLHYQDARNHLKCPANRRTMHRQERIDDAPRTDPHGPY